MLKVEKGQDVIRIENSTALWEWDLRQGGQLVRCEFKMLNGQRRPVLQGEPAPNFTMDLPEGTVSQAQVAVQPVWVREDSDVVVFTTQSRLADKFLVDQRFEVFEEGVVFCELSVMLEEGKKTTVRNAHFGFPLDVLQTPQMRINYITRDPFVKQDVTCVHVFPTTLISCDRDKRLEVGHLLPLLGLDLGWEESRYYSNRLEVILEDSTSLGGHMVGETRSQVVDENGKMQLRWLPCENSSEEVEGPFQYRNKWGLFCGAARNAAGGEVEPARRNNVIGSRVCHVMYPYKRAGNEWPEASIPIKQVWYQDAQIAEGNPEIERVDEAARLGCNVMIIHQFWMNNGGSNGEPMADYKVFDPEWFTAFVGRAHEHGMRVALYMRGVEHYSLYMDFFEKYMKRNWDGLYADWATPFGVGFAKASPTHYSVYNYFLFTRALRRRVGPDGILLGHTSVQTHTSFANFDCQLTGEFSLLHSGLLAEPEFSSSYAGLDCCGVHLMAGNAPDRIAFSSQHAAGLSAGLGYGNHPFMEPGKDFDEASRYIQPYWNLFRQLGSDPVRSYNPGVGTGDGLQWSHNALHPIAYQAKDGSTLLVVSNLSEETVSGTVTLDAAALNLTAGNFTPLQVEGTHALQVEGNTIKVENMPSYHFGGVLLRAAQ